MHRFLFLQFLFSLFLIGCAPNSNVRSETRTLPIFAASSLTNACTEIGKNFELANPNVTVTFNFAGSQALRTQIEESAPADVFASASSTEMTALVDGGLVGQDLPQIFLNNKLVLVLPVGNPAGIDSLEDLATAGVKIVLAAEEVPAGRYTREALEKMNGQFGSELRQVFLSHVVSNEDNVKQVVAKVQLGEADAGIVYTSDAVAAPELQQIEIPAELNVIAKYPIAPLVESANAELAEAFIAYVLSPDGQEILQKWGLAPAQ